MCLSQITSGYKYPVLDQLDYQNNFGLISFRPTNFWPSEHAYTNCKPHKRKNGRYIQRRTSS